MGTTDTMPPLEPPDSEGDGTDRVAGQGAAAFAAWEPVQSWAGAELGIAEMDSPVTRQRKLAQQLVESDFVPAADWTAAAEVLLEPPPADRRLRAWSPPIAAAVQPRLRAEIDQLAREFFELRPPERRQRWTALRDRCGAYPGLQHRLDRWQAGLDLTFPELQAGSDEAELLSAIAAAFVDPLGPRGPKLRRLTHRLEDQSERWAAAAATITQEAPEWARLAGEWLTRLSERQELVIRPVARETHDRAPQNMLQMLVGLAIAVTAFFFAFTAGKVNQASRRNVHPQTRVALNRPAVASPSAPPPSQPAQRLRSSDYQVLHHSPDLLVVRPPAGLNLEVNFVEGEKDPALGSLSAHLHPATLLHVAVTAAQGASDNPQQSYVVVFLFEDAVDSPDSPYPDSLRRWTETLETIFGSGVSQRILQCADAARDPNLRGAAVVLHRDWHAESGLAVECLGIKKVEAATQE